MLPFMPSISQKLKKKAYPTHSLFRTKDVFDLFRTKVNSWPSFSIYLSKEDRIFSNEIIQEATPATSVHFDFATTVVLLAFLFFTDLKVFRKKAFAGTIPVQVTAIPWDAESIKINVEVLDRSMTVLEGDSAGNQVYTL